MSTPRLWRMFIGAALVLLGLLLLLGTLGGMSFGRVMAIFWPALLIIFGLFLLLRPRPQQTVLEGGGPVIGEVVLGKEPWELRDGETRMAVGQVRLDLRQARMQPGETKLALSGGIGSILVVVPPELEVSVWAEVGVGSIRVLGEKADGLGRQLSFASPGYGSAEKRVRMKISLGMGEVAVDSLTRP